MVKLAYEARADYCANPTAKRLFNLMAKKESNLAISMDVTQKAEFLKLVEKIGTEICVLKTHIDIIEDFDRTFLGNLQELALEQEFLIFEDRKFADIGHTVALQYGQGIYRIADWAPIVNAHSLPGPGTIAGLQSVGLVKGNGLLLLAEMSSQGNLIDQNYTAQTLALALAYREFVIGFVTQHCLTSEPEFLHFTPGVHIAVTKDALGQQYITPQEAILKRGADVIIVGRGVYEASDPYQAAQEYRKVAWAAYRQTMVTDQLLDANTHRDPHLRGDGKAASR